MHDAIKAGRPYADALRDTQPAMQRELEADSVECATQQGKKIDALDYAVITACLGSRGWMLVTTAEQIADAYARAWWAEGIDPAIIAHQ
jgi:hypothetical protein